MASRADEMLGLAMSSFANRDLEIAKSLVTLDQSVNLAHHRFSDRLLDIEATMANRSGRHRCGPC